MRAKRNSGLFLSLVGVILVSAAVSAAPVFWDHDVSVGNLNPTDAIIVQELTAQGDTALDTTINALTIENTGTADHTKIVKIEVLDGVGTIGESTALAGLTTGGVTINVGEYTLAANAEELVRVRVTLGASTTITGGETVALRVKFHYVLGGTTYTTAFFADGEPETIVRGGADSSADRGIGPFNLDPGDEAVVQVSTFSDDDANAAPLVWQTNAIKIDNAEGTASTGEISQVTVTVAISGQNYAATKTWAAAGAEFSVTDFTPDLQDIPDNREATVSVSVRLKPATVMTASGNNKTIRTRTTLRVREGAAGSLQAYSHQLISAQIQRVRFQGLEVVEELSTLLVSGALSTGEYLAQTVRVSDDDVNDSTLELNAVEIRNTGTGAGAEFSRIEVLRGGVLVGAVDNPTDLSSGQSIPLSYGDQATDRRVQDDGSATLTILYYVGAGAVSGHTLKPRVRVSAMEEDASDVRHSYWSDDVTYPAAVTLYGPGFEVVQRHPDGPAGGDSYTGQRLLAQRIVCRDLDENDDDVIINPVVVKNLGTALGNPDIVRIEIVDSRGNTLGQTDDLTGFTTGGVAISTFANNVVADASEGAEIILSIYVTIADPEIAKAGRTINLETRVLHMEGGMGYEKRVTGPSWTIRVNHRPTVDFEYGPQPANVGKPVAFTAKVTDADGDAMATYEWLFGNGRGSGESADQNPSYTFLAGGQFDVTLIVTDVRGLTGTAKKTVVVNYPPDVTIAASIESPDIGVEVSFTAQVADPDQPDDTPYAYVWDFGDGTTSTEAEPRHSFAERKTYDVVVLVTDKRGGETRATLSLTVGNRAPEVEFEWQPTAPEPREVVTFRVTKLVDPDDPDDTPFTYAWTYEEETSAGGFELVGTSTAAQPTQAFDEGTLRITLVVTDARRGRTTVVKTLSVGNTPPVIQSLAANPAQPSTGDRVTFTASGVTDPDGDAISGYTWSFGDGLGTVETEAAVTTHTFGTSGTYTVSVIAEDSRGGRSVARTLVVTVSGPTQAILYAYPNPASSQATINLLMPDGTTNVVLRIFGIDGRLVLEAEPEAGVTRYVWNLTDDAEEPVGNGLYFCVVTGRAEGGGTVRSEVFRLLVSR